MQTDLNIDFFIIGAEKSGSTSLFETLKATGSFCSHVQPEMPFFLADEEYEQGLHYLTSRYFPDYDGTRPVLAKFAMAMYDTTTLNRLKRHNPRMKVITIVRNPVARAYSAYWYARRLGRETITSFSEALAKEEERLAAYLPNRNLCYVNNSNYPLHLKTVHSIFSEQQSLVFPMEYLQSSPAAALDLCLQFMDLDVAAHQRAVPQDAQKRNQQAQARNEKAAQMINRLFDPDNPLKRRLSPLVPHVLKDNFRKFLYRINSKPGTYPPLPDSDRTTLNHALQEAAAWHQNLLQSYSLGSGPVGSTDQRDASISE